MEKVYLHVVPISITVLISLHHRIEDQHYNTMLQCYKFDRWLLGTAFSLTRPDLHRRHPWACWDRLFAVRCLLLARPPSCLSVRQWLEQLLTTLKKIYSNKDQILLYSKVKFTPVKNKIHSRVQTNGRGCSHQEYLKLTPIRSK